MCTLQARLTRRIPGPAGKLQRLPASHAQGTIPQSSTSLATSASEDLLDPDFQSRAWHTALSYQRGKHGSRSCDSLSLVPSVLFRHRFWCQTGTTKEQCVSILDMMQLEASCKVAQVCPASLSKFAWLSYHHALTMLCVHCRQCW